jgi:hypothetical protein
MTGSVSTGTPIVDIEVADRVPVGVGLEITDLPEGQDVHFPEESLRLDDNLAAVLQVLRPVAAGHQHPAGRPGELVAERVVIVRRCRQAAAVGLEGDDPAALASHLVDDPHGRHVVDAGVDADLVHDGHARFLGYPIQRLHLVGDIAGCDHRLLLLDTDPGHQRVEIRGHKAHGQISLLDVLSQPGLVLQVELTGLAMGMTVDQPLGLGHRPTGAGQLVPLIEQVANERLGNQTSPQHQHSLHRSLPLRRRPPRGCPSAMPWVRGDPVHESRESFRYL